MKNNITRLSNCYGCGVCIRACPVNIISMKENEKGFYSPYINDIDKCIECGLCLKVCAFNHDDISLKTDSEPSAFAGWSNNAIVRQRCSSGGIGFEIGRYLIENGFKAIGVRYNPETNRAEHYIASTVEEFMPSIGSKYIPSNTAEAFSQIDRKQRYLVTGTPCQIDSIRRLIRQLKIEDNFILLDFFCHGVPSLLMWDKYMTKVKQEVGEVSFVSWRNKTTGWHDSWSMNADSLEPGEKINWHDSYNLLIKEKKHLYSSRLSQGDLFFKFFLGNYCLNECCYENCKYKLFSSSADIRIGDLWGKEYQADELGTSGIIAFTNKGIEIINDLKDKLSIQQIGLDVVGEGQMKSNVRRPWISPLVMKQLKTARSLDVIFRKLIRIYTISRIPYRIINKIRRTIIHNEK